MAEWKARVNEISEFAKTHYVLTGCLLSIVPACYMLRRWSAGGVCRSKARLDGKTVFITGGNIGLGKESGLDLARRGARVILACRDVQKGEAAAAFIRQQTGNGNVAVQQLDLASFKSIRSCAERVNATEDRLDILMNNAGVMACPKMKTEDGFEMQFGVNHLGHFLLTNLLLDLVKKSAPSRIVNLSSSAHYRGVMNWDDINNDHGYEEFKVYSMSKLANVLFTKSLAKRLEGTEVTTYAVHPGVVSTNLGQHMMKMTLVKLLSPILFMGSLLFMKRAQEGCQTQVNCAVDPDLANETGKFYADCREKAPNKLALIEEDAERLWDLSVKLTELQSS